MHRKLCTLLFAVSTAAQVVVPLPANATFYRTNQDPAAAAATALPIGSLGVVPGDWLRLRCVGDWDGGGSGDVLRELVGAFAATNSLLAATVQQRVATGIVGGTAVVLGYGTAVGALAMETTTDFWISRDGFSDEVTVRVPAGAVQLFLAVPDAFYSDNTDPDGDFGVEITLVPTPPYPGTGGEDLLLGTGVNATFDLTPIKNATTGDILSAALLSPLDTQAGNLFVLMADLRTTGTAPTGPLPGTWFGATAVVALGFAVLPTGPSATWSVTVPPGIVGNSLWLQGGSLWPLAQNGLFVASEGHEIRIR